MSTVSDGTFRGEDGQGLTHMGGANAARLPQLSDREWMMIGVGQRVIGVIEAEQTENGRTAHMAGSLLRLPVVLISRPLGAYTALSPDIGHQWQKWE